MEVEIVFPGLIGSNLGTPFHKEIAKRGHDALQYRAVCRLRDFIVKGDFTVSVFLCVPEPAFHFPETIFHAVQLRYCGALRS